MLQVLVLHGLAQERQGAAGFPAAVPDLRTKRPGSGAWHGAGAGAPLQPSTVPCHYLDGDDKAVLPEGLEEEGAWLRGLLNRNQVS